MLHTQGHYLKRFSAPLVGIHRRFITRRYHRGCPAAAIDPLQSESFPIRPSGSS
jgi:hypothetical protein